MATGTNVSMPTRSASFTAVMSSLYVGPGGTVMAYAGQNFAGAEVTFTQTSATIPAAFNDKMSSYTCVCGD